MSSKRTKQKDRAERWRINIIFQKQLSGWVRLGQSFFFFWLSGGWAWRWQDCGTLCVFFVLVISIGIFTLILKDLGLFHVDTGDRGTGAEMEKLSMLKQQGKEKSNIINSSLLKKNIERKPIVFTKAVFLELSAVWCLYATEGLLLIIHQGCWKPPPSHLIHIGNQHKSRLRKHITHCKTHKSQNYELQYLLLLTYL